MQCEGELFSGTISMSLYKSPSRGAYNVPYFSNSSTFVCLNLHRCEGAFTLTTFKAGEVLE